MKALELALIGFVAGGFLCGRLVASDDATGYDTNIEQARGARSLAGNFLNQILQPIWAAADAAFDLIAPAVYQMDRQVDMVRYKTYLMFMRLYNKTYSAAELPRRMALYFLRRGAVEESVRRHREGKVAFAMRENEFTDWSDEELSSLSGIVFPDEAALEPEVSNNSPSRAMSIMLAEKLVSPKDWRTSGCVPPAFHQKDCGASYAAAAVSLIETMSCLRSGLLQQFSVQQIVDCATTKLGYANEGCNGGHARGVFEYLKKSRLVSLASCYPYTGRDDTCRLSEVSKWPGCAMRITASGLSIKTLFSEREILEHVASAGPVVTTMKVTMPFHYYGTGIFDDSSCTRAPSGTEHAVVIVGYGSELGQDYWLVKNSWGTSWGEDGYAKYKRGTNACSIAHHGWALT